MNDRDRMAAIYIQGITAGRLDNYHGLQIEQTKDADGIYMPWFTVVTGDGTRIRVSFEPA